MSSFVGRNGWRGLGVLAGGVAHDFNNLLAGIIGTVDVFSSGVSALGHFRQNPARYSTAVIDLTMPEMSGEDLIAQLRRIQPDLAVIAITGFATTDVRERLAHIDIDKAVRRLVIDGDQLSTLNSQPSGRERRSPPAFGPWR